MQYEIQKAKACSRDIGVRVRQYEILGKFEYELYSKSLKLKLTIIVIRAVFPYFELQVSPKIKILSMRIKKMKVFIQISLLFS